MFRIFEFGLRLKATPLSCLRNVLCSFFAVVTDNYRPSSTSAMVLLFCHNWEVFITRIFHF